MNKHPKVKKTSIAAITVIFVAIFLYVSPATITSASTVSKISTPALTSTPVAYPNPGHAVASPDKKKAVPYTVVTDIGTDDLQVLQGTTFVGNISTSGTSIGAAAVGNYVYVAGFSNESVWVVNPATLSIVATIDVSSYGYPSGVVYSAVSGYVYVAIFYGSSNDGLYLVINPSTNTVVSTITPCGYFPEFGDVNLKTGNVYFANREDSSNSYYGCVDEITGTSVVATALLSDDYGVGVAVNQKTGDVGVVGETTGDVFVYNAGLSHLVKTVSSSSYLWGMWSNKKDSTTLAADYNTPALGTINKKNAYSSETLSIYPDGGCSSSTSNVVPDYGDASGVVDVITSSGTVTAVQTDGTSVFECATT